MEFFKTVIINDQEVNLEWSIQIKKEYVIAKIHLPVKNYPNTILGQTAAKWNETSLLELRMVIKSMNDWAKYNYALDPVLSKMIKHFIWVYQFGRLSSLADVNRSDDEKLAFRGIGRLLMKKTLEHVIQHYQLNIEQTGFFLEASGTIHTFNEMVQKKNEIFKNWTDKELWNKICHIYQIFPNDFNHPIIFDDVKNQKLNFVDIFVSLHENVELVKYYKRSFDLKVLKLVSIHCIFMGQLLSNVIKKQV